MMLEQLELHNFKSYKDTTIWFKQGTTIITGKNGAGKSTILEGINYALFKKASTNQKGLIRHGEKEMSVTLIFQSYGKTYKIIRKRTLRQSQSSIYEKNNDKSFALISESNKDVDNIVQQVLNVDVELFHNAIYIRQGEITALLDKTNSERKKIISKLLRIDSLEKAWNDSLNLIHDYNNKRSRIQGQILTKKQEQKEYESLHIKLNKITIDVRELEQTKAKLESDKTINDKKIIEMSEEMKEYALIEKEIQFKEKEWQNMEQYRRKLEKGKLDFERKQEEFNETISKMDNLDITRNKDEYETSINRLTILSHKNRELENSNKELADVDGECPVCGARINETMKHELIEKNKSFIRTNNAEMSMLNEKVSICKANINNYEALQAQKIRLDGQLSNNEDICLDDVDGSIKVMESEINTMKQKLVEYAPIAEEYSKCINLKESLDSKINECFGEIGLMKGEANEIMSRLDKLQSEKMEIKRLEWDEERISQFIRLLTECRELYGKDGIQLTMRKTMKPLIEKHMMDYFTMFGFEYEDIKLTDDYEVLINGPDGINGLDMMSGGERIAIALALRLGIARAVSNDDFGCILLDEPTVYLDSIRINELANLFCDMGTVPQLVIVTHESELERIGDNVLNVEKHNGASALVM